MSCDDLRLGGTLSASGITGGTSINSTAIAVDNWAGLLGTAGIGGQALEVNGRPGVLYGGDFLGRGRFFNLQMQLTRYGPNLTLVAPTEDEQLTDNTDDFLTLATVPETYLEVDMPDGTSRFLRVTNLDPAYTNQATKLRKISVPFVADWPYWREGGQEQTDTISGADTLVVGGKKTVYDPVLVFAGDGTFTNSTEGWSIEVTGSGGAVTVDLGNRTVTEGGNPALNRIRRTSRDWGWFIVGNNSVTSDVSVTVTWRNQYS